MFAGNRHLESLGHKQLRMACTSHRTLQNHSCYMAIEMTMISRNAVHTGVCPCKNVNNLCRRDILRRAKVCELPQLSEVTLRSELALLDTMASPMLAMLPKSPMHQVFAVRLLGCTIAFDLAVDRPMMSCKLLKGTCAT